MNNGDVDLEKPGNSTNEPMCYTAVKPFSVRLLKVHNRKNEKRGIHLPQKRAKSPITKGKSHESPPPKKRNTCSVSSQTRKVSLKISKINGVGVRCTPNSKKRRKGRSDDVTEVTEVASIEKSLGKLWLLKLDCVVRYGILISQLWNSVTVICVSYNEGIARRSSICCNNNEKFHFRGSFNILERVLVEILNCS